MQKDLNTTDLEFFMSCSVDEQEVLIKKRLKNTLHARQEAVVLYFKLRYKNNSQLLFQNSPQSDDFVDEVVEETCIKEINLEDWNTTTKAFLKLLKILPQAANGPKSKKQQRSQTLRNVFQSFLNWKSFLALITCNLRWMMNNENEIRSAAQSIYENIGVMNARGQQSSLDITRSHSINLITEEFLGGYTQDGRMSVVRRFFCLFVTFDLFFISLLWLICIMITGDNIYNALKTQVVHYTIYTSLFDVVMAAICRFIVLLLFYALLYINHWLIIACSTSGSCLFLISKVFVYDWVKSPEPVFQVVLIVTSFVLAWGEAWFLDCRVIPQERHARNYFLAITSNNYAADRSSLLAPLLASDGGPPTESHLTFYSPYDSRHDSDEEDEKDDEYKKMGKECVRKAYELLETKDWKIEKVSSKGDRIQSTQKDKLGKIYRLTAIIRYPAKNLLEELFYRIEDVPKWNPTLLESKIIRKVDTHTDISYQATVGGGGGLVQSRDFVNLRCWRLCCNGKVVDTDDEDEDEENTNCCGSYEPSTAEGSVSTLSDEEELLTNEYSNSVTKSVSEARIREGSSQNSSGTFLTLSKSLGAKDFRGNFISEPPPLDDEFTDATDNPDILVNPNNDRIYISAAISVDYPGVPNNPKYTRGQNLVSCWAMREIPGKPDSCIFEWLLCLDLKGYIPRYVLDSAYTSLMQDYMTYLRKYIKELRQKKRKIPDRAYS